MSAVIKNLTNSEAEAEEWRLRCDMAAVFRVAARLQNLRAAAAAPAAAAPAAPAAH